MAIIATHLGRLRRRAELGRGRMDDAAQADVLA